MSNIEFDNKDDLIRRVTEQISLEVEGDVAALYDFTLPRIREERIAERDDEPGLSLASIGAFVERVKSAEIISIEIEKFHEKAPIYSNYPAALVVTKIFYNNGAAVNNSRCVWVFDTGIWYSTALGKLW